MKPITESHTTYETAKALKFAGFQQPKNWEGNIWHIEGKGFCYSRYSYLASTYMVPLSEYSNSFLFDPAEYKPLFIPTAIDILKELGENYCLFANGDGWSIYFYETDLHCDKFENPAEACAAAWLEIHEKPQPK